MRGARTGRRELSGGGARFVATSRSVIRVLITIRGPLLCPHEVARPSGPVEQGECHGGKPFPQVEKVLDFGAMPERKERNLVGGVW